MVFDHLDNAGLYEGLGAGFVKAFAFLRGFQGDLALGRHEVDGDEVYAMVQSFATAPVAERKWESHRRYVDLQYLHKGEELIYHRDISGLTATIPYNEDGDYLLYEGPDDQALILRAGNFGIFWPHDGHKPSCAVGRPMRVSKVVMKVRVG